MDKHNMQVSVNRAILADFDKDMHPIERPVLEILFFKDSGTTREIISESTGYRLFRELKKALNLK